MYAHQKPRCTHMSPEEHHAILQADIEVEQQKWVRQSSFARSQSGGLSPSAAGHHQLRDPNDPLSPTNVALRRNAALGALLNRAPQTPTRTLRGGSPISAARGGSSPQQGRSYSPAAEQKQFRASPATPLGAARPSSPLQQRTQSPNQSRRSNSPGQRPVLLQQHDVITPAAAIRLNALERSFSNGATHCSSDPMASVNQFYPSLMDSAQTHRAVSPKYMASKSGGQLTASDKILSLCAEFTTVALPKIEPTVAETCRAAMQHNFVADETQRFMEQSLKRITNFLNSLDFLMLPTKPLELQLPPKPLLTETMQSAQWSAADLKKMKARQAKINRKKAQLDRERAILREKEAALAAEMERIAEQRRLIAERLAAVQPALKEAQEGLSAIKEEHLWEIKSYQTPPPMVHKVLSSVLCVLGEKSFDKWDKMKSFLGRKDFIPTIRDFDPKTVDSATCKRLKKFVDDPEYTYDNAYRASQACAPMVKWVKAMVKYAEVYATIRDIEEELNRSATDLIRSLQAAVDAQRRLVAQLEKEIEGMESAYEKMYGDHILAARDAEMRQKMEDRLAQRLLEWELACQKARAEHERYLREEAGKPPVVSDEAIRVANRSRLRCQSIVDAIQATLGSLKGPISINMKPLVPPKTVTKNTTPARTQSPTGSRAASSSPAKNRAATSPAKSSTVASPPPKKPFSFVKSRGDGGILPIPEPIRKNGQQSPSKSPTTTTAGRPSISPPTRRGSSPRPSRITVSAAAAAKKKSGDVPPDTKSYSLPL